MSDGTFPFDPKVAARCAARYASREFTAFSSWEFHDDELAAELMKDTNFVCAMQYAATRVAQVYRFSPRMQAHRDVAFGTTGPSAVVGVIMGEWLGGATTIDQEMGQW